MIYTWSAQTQHTQNTNIPTTMFNDSLTPKFKITNASHTATLNII